MKAAELPGNGIRTVLHATLTVTPCRWRKMASSLRLAGSPVLGQLDEPCSGRFAMIHSPVPSREGILSRVWLFLVKAKIAPA